jgi:H+/Cl- antiporter ClcA
VATAFAAPIGGLLFTVEEGVSFYSTSIFWRGFLSTGIGVFTLHFLVECAVRSPFIPSPFWLTALVFQQAHARAARLFGCHPVVQVDASSSAKI